MFWVMGGFLHSLALNESLQKLNWIEEFLNIGTQKELFSNTI
jgi:hypothetical protein